MDVKIAFIVIALVGLVYFVMSKNENTIEIKKQKKVIKKKKGKKRVKFNMRKNLYYGDETENEKVDQDDKVEEDDNEEMIENYDQDESNLKYNDYTFSKYDNTSHPDDYIDHNVIPYQNSLKRDKKIPTVVIDRINDIRENFNHESQEIGEVYDKLVMSQYKNSDRKKKLDNDEYFNQADNNRKTFSNDIWGYENENVLNGGNIEGELYANDPSSNLNLAY